MIESGEIDQIEKYLTKKLSQSELSAFNEKVGAEKTFADKVTFMKGLREIAIEYNISEQKKQIRKIIADEFKRAKLRTRITIVALLVIILAILALFFFMYNGNTLQEKKVEKLKNEMDSLLDLQKFNIESLSPSSQPEQFKKQKSILDSLLHEKQSQIDKIFPDNNMNEQLQSQMHEIDSLMDLKMFKIDSIREEKLDSVAELVSRAPQKGYRLFGRFFDALGQSRSSEVYQYWTDLPILVAYSQIRSNQYFIHDTLYLFLKFEQFPRFYVSTDYPYGYIYKNDDKFYLIDLYDEMHFSNSKIIADSRVINELVAHSYIYTRDPDSLQMIFRKAPEYKAPPTISKVKVLTQ